MTKNVFIGGFSKSDIIARPWAEAGYECHLFDLGQGKSDYQNVYFHKGDIRRKLSIIRELLSRVCFSAWFPPCTDLAISGSKHFDTKALRDAYFWAKSMELVYLSRDIGELTGSPYFIENPMSMIATLWRKRDYVFDPCDYGGYLEENHTHSLFPEYYPPMDAYNKETWLWTGGGFVMPKKLRVEPVEEDSPGFALLGGKSERTKEIRSVTPEGFSRAVFESNSVDNFSNNKVISNK